MLEQRHDADQQNQLHDAHYMVSSGDVRCIISRRFCLPTKFLFTYWSDACRTTRVVGQRRSAPSTDADDADQHGNLSISTGSVPVSDVYRVKITSPYVSLNSHAKHRRFNRSAAISVDPDPQNGSYTISSR